MAESRLLEQEPAVESPNAGDGGDNLSEVRDEIARSPQSEQEIESSEKPDTATKHTPEINLNFEEKNPDGSSVHFDKQGRPDELKGPDGKSIARYQYGDDDKTPERIDLADGRVFLNDKKHGWITWKPGDKNAQRMKDVSVNVNPDGTSSIKHDGKEIKLTTSGDYTEKGADGNTWRHHPDRSSEYTDKDGLTHTRKKNYAPGKEDISIKTGNGESWKLLSGDARKNGQWLMPDGKIVTGKLEAKDGKFSITDNDPANKHEMKRVYKPGSVVEIHNKNKSIVEMKDDQVRKVTYPDGWMREFDWQGKDLVGEKLTKPGGKVHHNWTRANGKTDLWKDQVSGQNVHSTGESATHEGEQIGEYRHTTRSGVEYVKHSDGRVESIQPTRSSKDVQRVFDKVLKWADTDEDGQLSKSEINKALQDPSYTGENAQLLAALKKNFDAIKGLSNDEYGRESKIDPNDIKVLDQYVHMRLNKLPLGADASKLLNSIDGDMFSAKGRIEGSSRKLFADSGNPLKSIVPDAVNQPDLKVGDCYFEVVLASMAASNPQAIKDMIKDNGNGTYDVTFPGKDPVTVTAPTNAELATYNGGSKHGTWPWVLRKAAGKIWNDSPAENAPPIEALDGGSSDRTKAMNLLTGKTINPDDTAWTSYDTMHKRMKEAFENGDPVTATINKNFFHLVYDTKHSDAEKRFSTGHAYSITGFEPNESDPKKAYVTIRNPWGGPNGTHRITLEKFNKYFSDFSSPE